PGIGTAAGPGMVIGHSIEVTIGIEAAPEGPERSKDQRTTRINTEHIVGLMCPIHDHILNGTGCASAQQPFNDGTVLRVTVVEMADFVRERNVERVRRPDNASVRAG